MHNKYDACLLADWCWWDQLLWYWNWVLYDKTIFGFSVVSRKFSWRHKSIDIHVINLTLKARHQVNTVWDSSLKKEIYIYFYEKKCVYIHTYICFFPKKNYIIFLFFFSKIKHPGKKPFSLWGQHSRCSSSVYMCTCMSGTVWLCQNLQWKSPAVSSCLFSR